MKGFPDLPPLWLFLGLIVVWGFAKFLPLVEVFGPWAQPLAIALWGVGVGLVIWSAVWFWRKKTTIEPHHDPEVLIVEGPYKISRNPIYLGMLVILTGSVLWYGALGPVWVPPVFAWIVTVRFIRPEEQALVRRFGQEASEYLGATRRWL
jgi:protein-S-isoprenylcysteine O-methyltransferase Ste14